MGLARLVFREIDDRICAAAAAGARGPVQERALLYPFQAGIIRLPPAAYGHKSLLINCKGTNMAESQVNGVLIQGARGEYYFIGAKDLEIYRLTDQEATRTKELVGPGGLAGAAASDDAAGDRVKILPALFGPIGTVVKRLADDPTASKVLRDDPTVGKFLRDDPTVSKVLRDDPTVSKKLRDDPTVSKIGRVLEGPHASTTSRQE